MTYSFDTLIDSEGGNNPYFPELHGINELKIKN